MGVNFSCPLLILYDEDILLTMGEMIGINVLLLYVPSFLVSL